MYSRDDNVCTQPKTAFQPPTNKPYTHRLCTGLGTSTMYQSILRIR